MELCNSDGHLYQPVVFYNKQVRVGFHSEPLVYPFYSPIVFTEPVEATNYLSCFIKDMVESKDLPEDSINKDGTINKNVINAAVSEITLGKLEKKDTIE